MTIPIERRTEILQKERPLVSIVVPGYNEASIVQESLRRICEYMETLEDRYAWELIFVNDGSTDGTGEIAEAFARERQNVRVFHHVTNFRLGQALRTGFSQSRGDYVVTMDVDLSYSPDHIERLLTTITQTEARIVIASPYMKGGKTSHVPVLRRLLSQWANRFLSVLAHDAHLSTLTGMVRAYDGRFLRNLDLKAMDVNINPEIIYKGMVLRARILEIPAHLDWGDHQKSGQQRSSSIRILKTVVSCLLSGFFFRPFMFFILPGFALLLISLYPLGWALAHTVNHYHRLALTATVQRFDYLFSDAIAAAFIQAPHAFLVGGFALMLSLQLISLGFLALQSKRYFEELFHLGSSIYKYDQENRK